MAQPGLGAADTGGDLDESELSVSSVFAVANHPSNSETSIRLLVFPLKGRLTGVPGGDSEHTVCDENRFLSVIIVRAYGHHKDR